MLDDRAGLFEDAGELDAARASRSGGISLGVLGAVFKGSLLLGLAPALASPARTQIVAAITHAGVEERG